MKIKIPSIANKTMFMGSTGKVSVLYWRVWCVAASASFRHADVRAGRQRPFGDAGGNKDPERAGFHTSLKGKAERKAS
jgi:hypothetical protein